MISLNDKLNNYDLLPKWCEKGGDKYKSEVEAQKKSYVNIDSISHFI